MASMAWAVQRSNAAFVLASVLLQWVGTLTMMWGLLRMFPAGPVMFGLCALVLGVAGRTVVSWWQGRNDPTEVA
jgi:hypothetical protein